MLASMAMSGRKQPLTLIAPQAIESFLKVLKQTTQLYLPFEINFVAIEELLVSKPNSDANSSLETEQVSATVSLDLSATHQLNIEVIKLSHRVDSYGFRLTQTLQTIKLDIDKLKEQGVEPTETWGKLQAGQDVTLEDGRQLKSLDYTHRQVQKLSVVVAGDNDTPQLLSEAVQGASVLVHEATYTQAVLDKIMARPDAFDPMHTPVQRIANFAQSVNLSNLILTHFSARYQPYDDPESKTQIWRISA